LGVRRAGLTDIGSHVNEELLSRPQCPSMRTARLSSRLLAQVACWRNLSSIASLAGRLRPTTGRLAHHRRSRPPAPRVERMTHRALAPGPRLRSPSCIITRRALTFRSTRTHPTDGPLSRRSAARSSRFPKSAAGSIATSGARPEPASPVRHCRDLPSFRPLAVPLSEPKASSLWPSPFSR